MMLRSGLCSAVLLSLCACAPLQRRAVAPPDLVDIETISPQIRLDIRYATQDNFTGQVLYPAARCLLRRPVAERLERVQRELEEMGLGLKVFDCYRPLSVQRQMWALVPDERYVADPAKGSRHNRGAAVDVTLVTAGGVELEMPTAYDDFSVRAHRDYDALPAHVIANRGVLERMMVKAGFVPLPTEWWHFDAPDWEQFEILDLDLSRAAKGA